MVAAALSGCSTGGYVIAKRVDLDTQIDKARVEATAKLDTLRKQEVDILNSTIAVHRAREQAAADHLFKGSATFATLKPAEVSRPTLIMGQSIQLTSTQLPPATLEAQAAAFKALQVELDEIKVTTEALKAQYEAELGRAKVDGELKAKALTDAAAKFKEVEAAKVTVLMQARDTEVALQKAKDKVQDKDLATAQREKEGAEHSERLKRWLMIGLGVVSLAAGAAAVFVPVPAIKRYGTIVAIAAGGLAVALPFITPTMVLIAILCVVVPVGLRVAWLYRNDHDDHVDTIRAVQEVKRVAPEVFKATVAPVLSQWHSEATAKRIDETLKQTGDV